jgi:hypothetical protein
MNNNGWITDRLPTAQDCITGHSDVWVYDENYKIASLSHYQNVWRGLPWQPISRPAPYVKPKRWSVTLNSGEWCLVDAEKPNDTHYLPKIGHHCPAVQRICDIYNEVMP